MQMLRPPIPNAAWCSALFGARAASKGGIIRRSVRSVEHEIGRELFLNEVRRRGFYHIECGDDQFVVICNDGQMKVHC